MEGSVYRNDCWWTEFVFDYFVAGKRWVLWFLISPKIVKYKPKYCIINLGLHIFREGNYCKRKPIAKGDLFFLRNWLSFMIVHKNLYQIAWVIGWVYTFCSTGYTDKLHSTDGTNLSNNWINFNVTEYAFNETISNKLLDTWQTAP